MELTLSTEIAGTGVDLMEIRFERRILERIAKKRELSLCWHGFAQGNI